VTNNEHDKMKPVATDEGRYTHIRRGSLKANNRQSKRLQ